MWGNYYTDVKYKKNIGYDKSKNIIYQDEESIKLRYIKKEKQLDTGKEQTTSIIVDLWHSPIEMFSGDLINEKTVRDCKESNGLDGKTHFWRVWTNG